MYTLAFAVRFADWSNPYDEQAHDYIRTFAITDPAGFAVDVCLALNDEREDGSTILTDLLDKATEAALDDGSEHAEYEQRIPHGQASPLEIWSECRCDCVNCATGNHDGCYYQPITCPVKLARRSIQP